MGGLFSAKNTFVTIGKETTWGTAIEPTAFLETTTIKGGIQYDMVESQISTGSRNSNGSLQVGKKGTLDIGTEFTTSNLGYFLKGVLGTESVSAIGGGEYKHSFSMTNSSTLPSWTLKKYEGDWRVNDCVGAIINSLSLEVNPKSIITGSANYIYKSEADKGIVITADNATETFSATAHGLANGTKVKMFREGAGALPAPLDSNTIYYVVTTATDSFQLSLTLGGSPIAITTDGTGTLKVYKQNTLTQPTQRPFIFNDGSLKLNGASFGECKSLSLSINNGLNSEAIMLNDGGELYDLPAGKFELSGSMNIVLNENSIPTADFIKDNTSFSVELTLDTGITLGSGTYKTVIKIDTARFKNVSFENDGDFLAMKCDFSAITSTPCTIDLHNNFTSAY